MIGADGKLPACGSDGDFFDCHWRLQETMASSWYARGVPGMTLKSFCLG